MPYNYVFRLGNHLCTLGINYCNKSIPNPTYSSNWLYYIHKVSFFYSNNYVMVLMKKSTYSFIRFSLFSFNQIKVLL